MAMAECVLGHCMAKDGRYEEAEQRLKRGYQTLLADTGPRSGETIEAIEFLIHLYQAWNKPEEAAQYQALSIRPAEASP